MTDFSVAEQTGNAVAEQTKVVPFKGKIESAYGRNLNENKFTSGVAVNALDYEASFDEIQGYEFIPEKEMPSRKEILAFVNNKRKANARQQAVTDALDAAGVIKPTLETDVDLQVAGMVRSMVASGKYTTDTATAKARAILGLDE